MKHIDSVWKRTPMIFPLRPCLFVLCVSACLFASEAVQKPEEPSDDAIEEEVAEVIENGWDLKFHNFYLHKIDGSPVPLTMYAREVNGVWKGAVGSSRGNFVPGEAPDRVYNLSWQHVDMSQIPIEEGRMKGTMVLHMTPDLWVPNIGRSFPITFEVDAEIGENGTLAGTYTVTPPRVVEPTLKQMQFNGGRITSTTTPNQPLFNMPDTFTLTFNLQGILFGGSPEYNRRCMVVYVGIENGNVVKASYGTMTRKRTVVSRTELDPELFRFDTISPDGFSGRLRIPTLTLDLEPCEYIVDVSGTFLAGLITGTNQVRVVRENDEDVTFETSFDGSMNIGVSKEVYKSVLDEDWFVKVDGHVDLEEKEHPRLLFRSTDLPALRERMETPEGQAILKRLRYLLDGANGNRPPAHYSNATHAYMGGGFKSHVLEKPGTYTFSHAAGYGLLYQLTGEQVYADLGKDAFEEALIGQRDRDDRYSFRDPGGGLRAGTVLGWMAVGYDLCYNGWDPEFRDEATRALAEYDEGVGVNLEALARATMPPGSNHFGAQVGGASLALLAVDGEPVVDQNRIDVLLRIVQRNMIRNAVEGFGTNGMFQEGDGPGSMSSHLSYLSGLQAWRTAKGLDMINNGRSNVPMATLKWTYLSRVSPEAGFTDEGTWDPESIEYPIRGIYPHNVWDRDGLSGAGYFAIGFGSIPPKQQPAHLWFYNEFFREVDQTIGRPFDTLSAYPHLAVSAFIHWPVGMEPVNPAEILPRITADTENDFYIWRNRWQDQNDFVMSLLAKRTRRGYMTLYPDKTLDVDGEPWANLGSAGEVQDWWVSTSHDQSLLTFEEDHQTLLVDFSGKSGADVLLATTLPGGGGEKITLGSHTIRFLFPRSISKPKITVDADNTIRIGDQVLTFVDGLLSFKALEKGSS